MFLWQNKQPWLHHDQGFKQLFCFKLAHYRRNKVKKYFLWIILLFICGFFVWTSISITITRMKVCANFLPLPPFLQSIEGNSGKDRNFCFMYSTTDLLGSSIEYCTAINMFALGFRHSPGAWLRGEDSIITIPLQLGQEKVVELVRLHFLKHNDRIYVTHGLYNYKHSKEKVGGRQNGKTNFLTILFEIN